MERVLFVNPPMLFYSEEDLRKGSAPIRPNVSVPALLVLGELRRAGYENHFIDMVADAGGGEKISRLRKNTFMLGMGFEELSERVRDLKPSAVLIESMFTINLEMVEKTAEAVKKVFREVPVIAGGSFAAEKPGWHMDCGSIDYVVMGDGENVIAGLLEELGKKNPDFSKMRGVAYRKGGIVVINEKPAPLPFDPAFDYEAVLFRENGEYRYPERLTRKSGIYSSHVKEGQRACVFYGSRGCPMGCDYCSSYSREGKTIRHMGGERLFEQVRMLHENFGVTVFYNQADTFGFHGEDRKFLGMVGEYRKKHPEITLNNPNAFFVRLFFKNGGLDKEFVSLLKGAGFNVITLAIETFGQRFNRKIDFSVITPEKILDLCKHIKSVGMNIDIYMMYGFPGETPEELGNDIEKAKRLVGVADEISWANLILFPGSAYYRKAVAEGWFTEEEYRRRVRRGYSFGRISDFFNFTEVPTQRLRTLFKNMHPD